MRGLHYFFLTRMPLITLRSSNPRFLLPICLLKFVIITSFHTPRTHLPRLLRVMLITLILIWLSRLLIKPQKFGLSRLRRLRLILGFLDVALESFDLSRPVKVLSINAILHI